MCEEVRDPAVQVPKAMVATIFINTFAGLLFLIPIVFVLPNIQDLINNDAYAQPVPVIILSAVGSPGAAIGLLIPLMVLALFCGIGCTTAASRCTWAFARDGAMPFSKWLIKINKSLDVPLNAMMLSMVVQVVFGVLYFGSPAAFNAFSGVGVICLTASYATPIAISLFTGRKQVRTGRFYLGSLGTFCNIVSVGMLKLSFAQRSRSSATTSIFAFANIFTSAWTLLAIPLFCMPSYVPTAPKDINYAFAVFAVACMASGAFYWVWGHRNYVGPPIHDHDE